VNHHHLHFHSCFPLDLRTVQTETARCRAVWAPHENHRATVLTVARWVVMILHHHQRTAARWNRARPRGRASRDVRHPLVTKFGLIGSGPHSAVFGMDLAKSNVPS